MAMAALRLITGKRLPWACDGGRVTFKGYTTALDVARCKAVRQQNPVEKPVVYRLITHQASPMTSNKLMGSAMSKVISRKWMVAMCCRW
jgi:hypothetical protein